MDIFHYLIKQLSRCLIFLDSANNLSDVQKCLPHSTIACHVLVTTRTTQNLSLFSESRNTATVDLKSLSGQCAVLALLSLSGKSCQHLGAKELAYATQIATTAPVEGVPIAILHAATFIRERDTTFEAYWNLLSEKQKHLQVVGLDLKTFLHYFRIPHVEDTLRRFGVDQPLKLNREKLDEMSLGTREREALRFAVEKLQTRRLAFLTWELDIDEMEWECQAGYSILCCCSVLASQNVPHSLISDFLSRVHRTRDPSIGKNGHVALQKYSLINRFSDNEGICYSIHHLIQKSVYERLKLDSETLDLVFLAAWDQLVLAMPLDMHNPMYRETVLELAPHFYAMAQNYLRDSSSFARNMTKEENIVQFVCNLAKGLFHFEFLRDFSLLAIERVRQFGLEKERELQCLKFCMCLSITFS